MTLAKYVEKYHNEYTESTGVEGIRVYLDIEIGKACTNRETCRRVAIAELNARCRKL
jgi:hypothetical protein